MTYTHEELLAGIVANMDMAAMAPTPEEELGAASMAYTLAIATMMLDGDLSHLPLAE